MVNTEFTESKKKHIADMGVMCETALEMEHKALATGSLGVAAIWADLAAGYSASAFEVAAL